MYSAIVKNSDNSWDVFFNFDFSSKERVEILNEAWESKLPIVAMELTPYKNTAKIGSTWNGTSFSGGYESDGIIFKDLPSTEEYWDSHKTYGFLCDNKVLAIIIVQNTQSNAEIIAEAMASEVQLIKTFWLKVGKTIQWDEATRTIS
jgi:hypothetical protein